MLSDTYFSTDSSCNGQLASSSDFVTTETSFSACYTTCTKNYFCQAFTYEPSWSGTNCFQVCPHRQLACL